MKRLLVVCEFGSADDNSTGHLVSMLPDLLDDMDVDILDARSMPGPIASLYFWLKSRKAMLFARFAVAFGLALAAFRRRKTYGGILVISNPFLSLLVPTWVWRGRHNRLFYLTFDLFPETLGATDLAVPKWLLTLLRTMRNRNLRKSDCVFAIGRDMKRYLETSIGRLRAVYTPLWIGDSEPPACPSRTEGDQRTSLHFFGNIGRVQDFGPLFQLLRQTQNLELHVFGGGAKEASFRNAAPDRVEFHGAVPFSERAGVFQRGTIGVVPQSHALVGMAVPSKAYYYWSRGLPILFLGSSDSELGQILTDHPALGCVISTVADLATVDSEFDQLTRGDQKSEIVAECVALRTTAFRSFTEVFERVFAASDPKARIGSGPDRRDHRPKELGNDSV